MADSQAPVREQISTAILTYLSLLQAKDADADATLTDLAQGLDRLVLAYHATPEVEPDSVESLAPRVGDKAFVDGAAAAFPQLEWYALADPEGGPDQEVGLSIAAGDLAEIAVDLAEVLWLFDNASENLVVDVPDRTAP